MYSASDDLPTPEKLRLLLKDIREARQSKIRSGLSAVNSVHLGVSSPFSPSSFFSLHTSTVLHLIGLTNVSLSEMGRCRISLRWK